MKNITLSSLFKPIARGLARFHMTLFIVFVVTGLAVAVLFINNILSDTSASDGYVSPLDAGSIDQTTLDRIKELHTSEDSSSTPPLPTGRINPFGE